MAPATNILLDFYGQTIENCRFMSHEDAEIAIITSMDPASGKFRATVVRTEGYGRKKKRAVIVSEVGTSLVDAIELLHTKSAEAVQNHVTTFGYDVVPRKKTDSKQHKRTSSAGNRWEDSEAEASDSDASDATESTAHLSETSLSDDETVSITPAKKSKKQKKPSAVNPQTVRSGSPPFMPAWPSQNRVGVPPPPPGFPGMGIHGRQPVNPSPGALPNPMPRINGSAVPRPMPPPPPKGMIPPMSAATIPSPPAPPVISPTTASATGPSGVPANLARPPVSMPFSSGLRAMPMAPGRPLNPADTNVETKRDAIVDITWAGHDGSATIFVCCPLSKQVIGQQVLRYVRTHTSEFGPARTSTHHNGLIYVFTSVVLPLQSPKSSGGSEKTYGLQTYENDDMSTLCNRVSPSSAVPRFEVMVVGKWHAPPPPGPGLWGDAGKPRQVSLAESTSDASVIVDDY